MYWSLRELCVGLLNNGDLLLAFQIMASVRERPQQPGHPDERSGAGGESFLGGDQTLTQPRQRPLQPRTDLQVSWQPDCRYVIYTLHRKAIYFRAVQVSWAGLINIFPRAACRVRENMWRLFDALVPNPRRWQQSWHIFTSLLTATFSWHLQDEKEKFSEFELLSASRFYGLI
jgi:hypothetical protein